MNSTIRSNRILLTSGLVVVATLGLAACSTSGVTPTPSPSVVASDSAGVVAPIVVSVKDLPGSLIEASIGDFIDINVEGSDPAWWTATMATPSVAEFLPGGPNGDAVDNPGFAATGVGSTTVEMTDGTTIVEFTITVTAD